MNPTKPAPWRSFCPQFNRGLTFQLVLNLGKGQEQEVVGVLKEVRFNGPTEVSPPLVLEATRPEGLEDEPLDSCIIKTTETTPGIHTALKTAAQTELKGFPFSLESLEELRDKKLAQPRQLLLLSSLMGTLALLLSLSGLYGLAAHLAESRRREMGIRVALGAGPGRILATLTRASLLPVLPGLAAGSFLAIAISRLLVHQGASTIGLSTQILIQSCLLLAAAAALACFIPAWSAARVHPSEALRSE